MFRSVEVLAAALAFAALGVGVARAQESVPGKLSFEGEGGVAIPGSQLHQFATAGPAANLELAYSMRPRLAVEVFGGFSRLKGETLTTTVAPDLDATDYGVGLKGDLLPAKAHWSLTADVGVGVSSFRSDLFTSAVDSTREQFKHTYPATMGGLQVGYHFRPRIGAFVGTDMLWAFTKTEDTALLHEIDGSTVQSFNRAWTMPITLGVKAII
jgi:hypothetical protein